MKLLINQNQVGKFNFGGDDTSLAFSLKFVDDENNILKVMPEGFLPPADYEGKTELAVFKMPSHSDDDPENWGETYKALFDEMDFESLLQYHIADNSWTTGFSYEAQRTMFVTLLDQHYEEICEGIRAGQAKHRELEIERLQKRLDVLKSVNDEPLPDKPDLKKALIAEIDKDIKRYKTWRDEYAKGNDQWKRNDTRLKESRAKKVALVQALGIAA